jgi:biopolymer transport protein ExbB
MGMIAFFQKGGLFMYPILLVFVAGMAIAAERWFQLNRIRGVNRKMWDMFHPVLAKGEFDKAQSIIDKDKSTISQMLGMGLARQGAVRRREDIEIAMEESMMEIIPQLEKRTPYVALLANIATLLGLLGLGQHLRGHEHHRLWPDVGDSASAFPRQADDRGQPGDGIGKGAEQHFRFQ